MRTSFAMFLLGILAVASVGPSAAHTPYFTQSERIDSTTHGEVTLRLLSGDGILFSDPMRAVIVSQEGRLLAASPMSASLRIVCQGTGPQRQCLAYDELTHQVYRPSEQLWRDGGLIEADGRPQAYPEDMTSEFGFQERQATLAEIFGFEVTGLVTSWQTTGVALAWWTAFWVLLLPVARFIVGRSAPPSIGTLVTLLLRTAGALLMIPITAYAWLVAPYSAVYLAFVVPLGAMAAHLTTGRRREQAT